MRARDLMKTAVGAVNPKMTLRELATYLDEEEIHGAPVIDGRGRLVGVVSRSDLVRTFASGDDDFPGEGDFFRSSGHRVGGFSERLSSQSSVAEMKVSEIMSLEVVTTDEDATPGELARRMIDEQVHRVIVTRGERVSGIISATDLLQVIVDWERERETAPD